MSAMEHSFYENPIWLCLLFGAYGVIFNKWTLRDWLTRYVLPLFAAMMRNSLPSIPLWTVIVRAFQI